jgi:hypothetical protein
MKNYEIANKTEIDAFINSAMINNQTLTPIKGKAPHGALYSDGDLIINSVNIAWLNDQTGETVDVIYQKKI